MYICLHLCVIRWLIAQSFCLLIRVAIRAEGVCFWPTVWPSGQEERLESARLKSELYYKRCKYIILLLLYCGWVAVCLYKYWCIGKIGDSSQTSGGFSVFIWDSGYTFVCSLDQKSRLRFLVLNELNLSFFYPSNYLI